MFLSNHRGFNIIELTVALGLFGMVSLASFSLLERSSQITSSGRFQEEYLEIENMARLAVSRAGACGIREAGSDLPVEFANSGQLPVAASNLNGGSPLIPVELFLTNESGETQYKRGLSEKKMKDVSIEALEIVFPDLTPPLPDGTSYIRGKVVIHIQKIRSPSQNDPLPPITIDSALRVEVASGNVKVVGCGSSWTPTIGSPEPPRGSQNLGLGQNLSTNLGPNRLCILIDRGLETGQSHWDNPLVPFDADWKNVAQKANFNCSLSFEGVDNPVWGLIEYAEKKDGLGGRYSCRAFCL